MGRDFAMNGLTVTPSVGVDWLRWDAGAFREEGGLALLNIAGATRDQRARTLDWRSTGEAAAGIWAATHVELSLAAIAKAAFL